MIEIPVFESSRKVQEFGSSLAMTLPAFFVKANEVEKGSVMKVYYSFDGVLIASWINDPDVLKEKLIEVMEKLDEKILKKARESV